MQQAAEQGGITPNPPLVALSGARMHFGAVRALDGVSLSVSRGECIGLVGHNGAGKSTAVNIINGGLQLTEGEIRFLGELPGAVTPAVGAREAGIRSVFQELSLCPNLTVEENMRVLQHDINGINWRRLARKRIMASLDAVFPGHKIRADMPVGDLSLAERQMTEIAAGFADSSVPASLVILDEPTSSLDAAIARQLLDYVRRFCAEGGAVLFISHMLHEIFDVATRIDVLKDGKVVTSGPADDFTHQSLIQAMGQMAEEGGDAEAAGNTSRTLGETVVTTGEGLTARKGEIVGLAGLAGHGQAEALAKYYLDRSRGLGHARRPEVVFVAGDRTRDGVFPLWSILKNLSLTTLGALSRATLVDRDKELALAGSWKETFGIRTDDVSNPILSLSGGNQQKVLFARSFASDAPIIVMDDPMRGVDVGTKREAYELIRKEAEGGRTFLWYSTETEEILRCDRVFVFRSGRISAELTGADITEENILAASFEMQGGEA